MKNIFKKISEKISFYDCFFFGCSLGYAIGGMLMQSPIGYIVAHIGIGLTYLYVAVSIRTTKVTFILQKEEDENNRN
jgi:hypothetical protein